MQISFRLEEGYSEGFLERWEQRSKCGEVVNTNDFAFGKVSDWWKNEMLKNMFNHPLFQILPCSAVNRTEE